jgi:hypothetical protein
MIKITRYSRNMYVVRGDTSKCKNKLKSFGMKFIHDLKGGSGYILRIRCKNDLYLLKKIKKYVENKVKNEPEVKLHTISYQPYKNKYCIGLLITIICIMIYSLEY